MKYLYQQIKRRREAEGLSTNAGFTLIELLIVIVVLGILAGVVIFALGGVTGKSAKAACQADGATVSTAISAFKAQNSTVTVTQAALTATALGGPYLQSWPSNAPHYGFAIGDGVSTDYGGAAAGVLVVNPTTATTYTATTTGWIPYAGPTSCASVS
ncbi:MAG TPA: prepilin-type N-terminal cleavage/methylation domain-containing protein [Acidimicrobiales bacterium]|nr:prepilin-type N-terminal cleavage/methylation domain-containing protein [Acidimicrobiales bacterium]